MKGKLDRQMFTKGRNVLCSAGDGLIVLQPQQPLSQMIAMQRVMTQGEE